jgi:hypothetical protein
VDSKLTKLKSLLVALFANLVLRSQKGYSIQNYDKVILAMESVTFIENYTTDTSSPYYLQAYKVDTIIDYHLRELNQL